MWLHHRDLRKSDPLKLSTQPLAQQKFPCQKSLTPSFSRVISITQPECRLEKHLRRVIDATPITLTSCCRLPGPMYCHAIRPSKDKKVYPVGQDPVVLPMIHERHRRNKSADMLHAWKSDIAPAARLDGSSP